MKGHAEVISHLKELLSAELAARDQYFVQSEMHLDWGFNKLHAHAHHEMDEETEHAARLIARILFLEGTPDLSARAAVKVGGDIPSMLSNDPEVEVSVTGHLKEVIAHCESVKGYQTRDILPGLLKDTEQDHALWLKQQLSLIEQIGLHNYLQPQT
jgi:bacterioferritin